MSTEGFIPLDDMGGVKEQEILPEGTYDLIIEGYDMKTGKECWSVAQPDVEGVRQNRPDIGKLYHNLLRKGMPNLVYYKGVLLAMHSGPNGGYKWVAESTLQVA